MRRLRHLLVAALALIVLVAALAAGYSGAAPAAKQTPIKIGYVNDESGPFAVPFVTIGTKVAEKYVNDRGGVGKSKLPIKVVYCAADGSPEKSIDCANKFVTAKVSAVLQGQVLATTALPENPDVIGTPSAADPECVGMLNALRSAGYGKSIRSRHRDEADDRRGARLRRLRLHRVPGSRR